ncbi:MAG: hypothetical protein J6P94_06380, partial [Oscillospiraceae bacterium]|nr:hypothetical protein [Oscillospiraceae bacterium]
MKAKILIPVFILLIVFAAFFWVSLGPDSSADDNDLPVSDTASPAPNMPEDTAGQSDEPVDLTTVGGVVLVGKIEHDEQGWYFKPEQPLNISYEYFYDNPSEFSGMTRVSMFDPKDDGVEKAPYLDQTVTAAGTFQFFRNDFETLYFVPYTITMGKSAEQSYAAPELTYPGEPANLYDPTWPLPKYVDPMIMDGQYVYNAFMLSQETIEFMGNDFVTFYVDFVDAFLSYRSEVECPDKRFAEMLSTVIYYEFPLYAACAEHFEFYKDYNAEKGTVSIKYLYDEDAHIDICDKFLELADNFLAETSPNK